MKYKLTMLIILVLSVGLTFPSYAAEWQHDNVGGWWYQEDDGSYPVEIWKEIQGKWYYFNSAGYLLTDTITPDGYHVGNDGAWIEMDEEQVYEIVSEFLMERGTTGYWLLSEGGEPGKVEIWEHWRTGVKGKIIVYLDTGDCYEEAPYAGVDYPHPDLPLERNLLFNIYSS